MQVELVQTIQDSNECIWCCAWSGNGKLLASAGSDCKIRLYQFASSSSSLSLSSTLSTGHQKSIRSLSFAPRRSQLAAASFDGTVSIWGGKSEWSCTATVEGHENEVKAAAWASFIDEVEGEEQRFLATCGRDKTVWIWAVEESLHDPNDEDYDCLAVLQEHDQDIKCLAWHPSVPLFLTGSYDESVRVWGPTGPSLDDWVALGVLVRGAGGTIWSIAFDAQGRKVAVALSTGQLILFTLPDGWKSFKDWQRVDFQLFQPMKIENGSDCCSGGGCNDSESKDSSESSGCCKDESKQSSGCCKDEPKESKGCCKDEPKESSDCCKDEPKQSSDCCKDEPKQSSGCCKDEPTDSPLQAPEESSGCCGSNVSSASSCCSQPSSKPPKTPIIPAAELFSASWSPDGRFLLLATTARSMIIFDAVEGKVVHELKEAHDEGINCVAWNPQYSTEFVSCSEDGSLKLWKLK